MEDLYLGLNQLQAAKYEYSSEHVCDWSKNPRPFSTIAIMQKGSGHFTASGKEMEIRCGNAFFIPAGSRYISYWKGEKGILYYAIHFHIDNRHSKFSPQKFSLQKIESLNSESFLPRFEAIHKYISSAGFTQLKAYSLFYDLYADVLPLLQCEKMQNSAFNNIRNAVDYIEQNSEKEFSVGQLAQMCHLSESRFYALFHRTMGCPPIAYRNNVRIRKAVAMLCGEYTFEEIATKVGFSSAIYFRRIFKEIMGKLPSEYKKSLQFSVDEL